MNMDFDFDGVRTTEFGIGCDEGNVQTFCLVPVDDSVQGALFEMAQSTWQAMQAQTDGPSRYEPSEKYGGCEYVFLPFNDDMVQEMRNLHQATNLPIDASAMSNSSSLFCYFVHMTDGDGRRLTALRRATQFKGVLKKRLLRFVTDSLKIIEDNVFKLDTDFDLLIDSQNVHILRPAGFEFVGKLKEAVLAAVPQNIEVVQQEMSFVDFSGIQGYASQHPRAARYLASILTQSETQNINKQALIAQCKATGVEIQEADGIIAIQDKHVMGFLEVLDRRRYVIKLQENTPECFKAASRRRLQGENYK